MNSRYVKLMFTVHKSIYKINENEVLIYLDITLFTHKAGCGSKAKNTRFGFL
jgi:hypothetical protein